jgi:DNA invertase Pin-like site-specific DNA recombinase
MKNIKLTNHLHELITPDHLRRKAIVYCRKSTKYQADAEDQRSLARSYGWPDSQIEIIDEGLKRLGSSSGRRSAWYRLHDMIDANLVGAVFVATNCRQSRQGYDFEVFRLLAALRDTLLFADEQFLDPKKPNRTKLSKITAMVAARVAAREKNRPGNDTQPFPDRDPSGSTTTTSICGKDTDQEKSR